MKIEYTLKAPPTKDVIKTCDESRKAFQDLIMETAKIMEMGLVQRGILWILLRFYKHIITDKKITYHFYLLAEGKHETNT